MNKKKTLLLIVALLFVHIAWSQVEETETNAKKATFLDKTSFGVKLGANFPNMNYSDKDLQDFSSDIYAKFMFELFFEYKFIPALSLRPGVKFLQRGQHIDETDFRYRLDAKYTELTLPVIFYFNSAKSFQPYLFAGPVVGFARGGDIYLGNIDKNGIFSDQYSVPITDANINSTAFGVFLGAGATYHFSISKFPLAIGLEAGYHLGLTDTYSDKEKNGTAIALNEESYNINGTRKNRGVEAGITLYLPLAGFKNNNPKPKKPEPEPQVVIPPPEPQPVVVEPEKLCYTIEEIKELIKEKQDIRGKKICAIKQVNFEFAKSDLTKDDKVYLNEIVDLMKMNQQIKIKVNGHTDNVGTDEFNRNLSRNRAKAVYDYLITQGIASSRLMYEYYGFSRPIADNDTEEGRAINRRVEFEITNQ